MPFDPTDLYSASAGTEIYNYWNPFVTKFDSQSFYNFEQDNQPLYDLEERTRYLWEKSTGYATSALYGMPLVVSSTLDPNNRNVFTSLQDAVDTLPDIIRTPTLIEVAVSGQIGGLWVKNIEIKGPNGMLEIINRGHAKIYSGSNTSQVAVNASSIIRGATGGGDINNQGIIGFVSSIDLSSTIADTSAISVETNVSGLFLQNGWNRTFLQIVNLAKPNYRRNDKLSVGFIGDSATSIFNFQGAATPNQFQCAAFERNNYGISQNNINDPTIGVDDVSCVRGDNGEWVNRNNTPTAYAGDLTTGSTYCNSLSAIQIEQVAGDFRIRGFNVDAVSGADTNYESTPFRAGTGIKIHNSDVRLENCSVMRASNTGVEIKNSNVFFDRGFFAYRNYQIAGGVRVTGLAGQTETIGISAYNSSIKLNNDNSTYASGLDYAFNIQGHNVGIKLQNCRLWGGQKRVSATKPETTIAIGYNNTGIFSEGSNIEIDGNLDIYNNDRGLILNNSILRSDHLTVENNNNNGILSDNSLIVYNKNFTRNLYNNDVSGFRMTQTLGHRNGTHLTLQNGSKFTYDETGSNVGVY